MRQFQILKLAPNISGLPDGAKINRRKKNEVLKNGALNAIRTHDLLLRREPLYPAEL